jgi:hypothetical protein
MDREGEDIMSITTVIRYQIRPDKLIVWENALTEIATRAEEESDPLSYTCLQVQGGPLGRFYITLDDDSLADAAARQPAPALIARLFEEGEARRIVQETSSAIEAAESIILRDRPELSYSADQESRPLQAAWVTTMVVAPGHRDACEELLRKVAEAIPKTDDVRRFTAYQPMIGDMREMIAVRPVYELAELDQVVPVEELLNQAFGSAEGGLIFRAAMEGVEQLTSELLLMRRDLSRISQSS